VGWGEKRTKTPAELDLKRRRELGLQHYSTLEELQEIASKSRVKIKKIPPAVHPDDIIDPAPVEAFNGACQQHVEYFKNCRAAKAAGAVIVQEDEPVPTDREKKLAASRAYNKANYVPRRSRGPGKKAKAKS
jgi:hypothetical protein